jgi:hypothetical protein
MATHDRVHGDECTDQSQNHRNGNTSPHRGQSLYFCSRTVSIANQKNQKNQKNSEPEEDFLFSLFPQCNNIAAVPLQ